MAARARKVKNEAGAEDDAPKKGGPAWLTAGYVQSLYDLRKLDGEEAKLRAMSRETRTLVDMQHAVSIPPQYEAIGHKVRTPFARDTWLRVTAALTRDHPVAHVEPRSRTQEAKEAANIGERWTWAMFTAMNKALGEDVVYESTKALVRDSESVVKVVHRPDAWASFPERAKGENAEGYEKRVETYKKGGPVPFAWRVVDRLSMLFGDGEFGDDWALEYGEYPKPYLGSRFGMVESDVSGQRRLVDPRYLLGGAPRPEGDLVTASERCAKIEYWDQDWWAVVIDGSLAPGFPKPNPYSKLKHPLPYFRAKCEPVLFSLLPLVPALDRLLTMKQNWAYLSAYPNPVLERDANAVAPDLGLGDDDAPSTFTWKPGKMIEPPAGYKFRFISPPPEGAALDSHIREIIDLIGIAGIAGIMRGQAAADASGYLANQLIAAATLTYRRLSEALRVQFAQAGEFLWELVEHRIKQEVYVLSQGTYDKKKKTYVKSRGGPEYLGLKPGGGVKDQCAPVEMLGPLAIEFRPVLPTDEQARAMIALQLVNAPKQLISKRFALEHYLQHEDPEGMADEIAVEDALDNDPTLRQIQISEALSEAGIADPNKPPTANPAASLVGPDGMPLISAYPAGQMGSGTPGIPGLTQPMQPGPPGRKAAVSAPARGAGGYPGMPGGNLPAITV